MISEQCGSPYEDLFPSPDAGVSVCTAEDQLGIGLLSSGQRQRVELNCYNKKESCCGKRRDPYNHSCCSVEALLQIRGYLRCPDPRHLC